MAQNGNACKVWSKFSAKNSSGTIFNFRIVDLPGDRYDDFTEQFMNCFAKEERSFLASGVTQCAEAMEEFRQMILKNKHDKANHIVICCLDNENDVIQDIIGGSMMMLGTRDEVTKKMLPLQLKTAELIKRYEIFAGMVSRYDCIKEFNLERYFIDRGLFVHADYRGLGIAQEMLRVRRLICNEYGVAMHGAWMTSYGTQKAAARDGWETVYEIQYDEYGKKHGVIFENGPPSCKYMVVKISLS